MQKITIIISTIFQDAGDATRALEIGKGLRKYQPDNIDVRIIFISHGSRFEEKAVKLGFEIYHARPKLPGIGLYQDLGMTITNLIGTEDLAREMILGEIEAYKEVKPDIVIYGFWPIASLARRMLNKEIPGICFAPLPLVSDFLHVIPDVPDQLKILSVFPKAIRLWLFHYIPYFVKSRAPLLRQNNIRHAAFQLGWNKRSLINTFDLLKSDLTIVNDFPQFYDQKKFPASVVFTGPLFSKPDDSDTIDPEIEKVFAPSIKRPRIFCSLSSSGSEEMLSELIKIFTYGKGLQWNAVILSPHFSVDRARELLGKREGVYITDKFIPALKVNSLADITVSHGGQGTLQTAVYSATPIVGVAAQQEQFMNLSNLESYGAGIRIPQNKWNAKNIQQAVCRVLSDKKYLQAVFELKQYMATIDGARNASVAIWNTIQQMSLPI